MGTPASATKHAMWKQNFTVIWVLKYFCLCLLSGSAEGLRTWGRWSFRTGHRESDRWNRRTNWKQRHSWCVRHFHNMTHLITFTAATILQLSFEHLTFESIICHFFSIRAVLVTYQLKVSMLLAFSESRLFSKQCCFSGNKLFSFPLVSGDKISVFLHMVYKVLNELLR